MMGDRFPSLARLVPSLDWMLPLALPALAFQSGGDPTLMVLVLVAWLVLRLLRRRHETPLVWVLIGTLCFSLASLLQPSSRSHLVDPLLFCVAFGVGMARGPAEWRRTLDILALTLLPAAALVRLDRLNDNRALIPWDVVRNAIPEQAMRLQDIAINDSAYIFSMLTLCAWLLLRWGGVRKVSQGVALALLVVLGYGVLFGTGSRAGLLLPVVIAAVLELIWRLRRVVQRFVWQSYSLLLLASLLFVLALTHPNSPLAERTVSDTGRAYVARCFWQEAQRSPVLFLTGHGGDVVNDRCIVATRWSLQPDGVRHAHNQYLQTLADFGAIPLLLLLAGIGVCWCQAVRDLQGTTPLPALISLMTTLLMMSFSLIEPVLLAISFKQILTGYLLAASWPQPQPEPQRIGWGGGR